MAKGKKAGPRAGGPHKNHGPKTHRFHGYSKMGRFDMGRAGALSKYSDKEAFFQSLAAKGVKGDLDKYWHDYCNLKGEDEELNKKQREFVSSLKK